MKAVSKQRANKTETAAVTGIAASSQAQAQAHAGAAIVDLPERALTAHERRVKAWIKSQRGVLSQVARELGLSVAFVQRVAYNREAKSKGLRVEHRLRALGCPLAQRVQ